MSCDFCENFDPNDNKEGWYSRPSGGQYELNQHVGGGQGPHAGPKTSGTVLTYDTSEPNDDETDYTPSVEGFKHTIKKKSSRYNLVILILLILAILAIVKCVQKFKK